MFDRYRTVSSKRITPTAVPMTALEEKKDVAAIARDFVSSVKKFSNYRNELGEPFVGDRKVADSKNWPLARQLGAMKNLRVAADHRLDDAILRPPEISGVAPSELNATICDYEVVFARTTDTRSRIGFEGAVNNASCDLLLRAKGGVPVAGEVKSSGDSDALSALIQGLTYAMFMSTKAQRSRLAAVYKQKRFATYADEPRLDVYVLVQRNPRSKERELLLGRAARYGAALVADKRVSKYIRRIVCLDFGEELQLGEEQLETQVVFAFERIAQ
ncbi:MAG: hypothetical protein ACSLFF_04600 [Solirubrobacterales bacterium]